MAFSYDKYKESNAVANARKDANKYKTYVENKAVADARKNANKYNTYKEGQNVIDARTRMNNAMSGKPADWTGGTYGATLNDILSQINNREKFSYDLNADALYQQYKQQYMNQGKLAMVDTIGQASALTGGYGSSYAETVGNQAYQGYLQKLNDVVPQLYQMAMDKYNMEGQDLYNRYNATQSAYNTEYGQYRDTMSDWLNDRNYYTDLYNNERSYDRGVFESDRDYAYNRYNNERNFDYGQFSDNRDYYTNVYNNERSWDYGLYSDAYDRAMKEYQLAQAEKAAKSSGGGSRNTKKKNDEIVRNDETVNASTQYQADNNHMNNYKSTIKQFDPTAAKTFVDTLLKDKKISEKQYYVLADLVGK